MTTAGSALRLSLRTCWFPSTSRLVTAPRHSRTTTQQRTFSTTQLACARYNSNEGRAAKDGPYQHLEDAFKDLSPEQLKQLEGIVSEHEDTGEPTTFAETLRANEEEPEARRMADPFEKRMKSFQNSLNIRPESNSMWSDATDEEAVAEQDVEEFKEDDMTSMAHGKLDEIREWRHYARIAAWEMPLLSKLAKPFSPPAANQPLRFRYTTYMGEFHPAEKKVVVEFSPADMGLTPVQTDKLKKLVGPRYNPDKDVIKMSCDSFGQPAQNKRYLSDLIDTLVEQAKVRYALFGLKTRIHADCIVITGSQGHI